MWPNVVRRQVQEMEAAREQKAGTLQDQIEANKLDIILPGGAATKEAGFEGLEGAAGKTQRGPRAEAESATGLPANEG
jgi:hypothetical protein